MEPLIDTETAVQLRKHFETELIHPLTLHLYTDGGTEGRDFTATFLSELSALSPKLSLEKHPYPEWQGENYCDPVLSAASEKGLRIAFYGIPSGHEANTILEMVRLISRSESELSNEENRLLQMIDRPVKIEVFVTTECPYCPQAAQAAIQMAIANPKFITAAIVEVSGNAPLANSLGISSVPHTLVNRNPEFSVIGAQPAGKIIEQILRVGASNYEAIVREAEEEHQKRFKLLDHPDKPVFLDQSNFQQALLKYPKLVIDFWAEWCSPCRLIAPILETLAVKYHERVVFAKVNVDENPEIAERFEVTSIPTMLIFLNGAVVTRLNGALPKAELEHEIIQHLKLIQLS